MAYNKIRYFKTKTLPPGKFANALRSALSRYTLNPESAHLDLVMHFADNSGQRYEYAKFDNLQTICDLGSDFGLTMRFMAEFKISDSATFMDNIYIHFRGMKDCIDIFVQAETADYVGKIFDAVIAELQLEETKSPYQPALEEASSKISVLFLAAAPINAPHLRLDEELREIQEKLQLAKLRDRFLLHPRMSVRPADITQAFLDVLPQIVHFSGHGIPTGELCFEDQIGGTHPIQPNALASLFEQFASHVNCVVLNACYSEMQADAIAQHIGHVIGTRRAIDDKAAIAFAVGFYQALGAGRTIEDAYKLGCVQIRLHNVPEQLMPILMKKN